jgi:hypothetical protein
MDCIEYHSAIAKTVEKTLWVCHQSARTRQLAVKIFSAWQPEWSVPHTGMTSYSHTKRNRTYVWFVIVLNTAAVNPNAEGR